VSILHANRMEAVKWTAEIIPNDKKSSTVFLVRLGEDPLHATINDSNTGEATFVIRRF